MPAFGGQKHPTTYCLKSDLLTQFSITGQIIAIGDIFVFNDIAGFKLSPRNAYSLILKFYLSLKNILIESRSRVSNLAFENSKSTNVQDFDINKLITTYVKPAVGCTEPAAIALAVSTAFYAAKGHIPQFIKKERHLNNSPKTTEQEIDNIKEITLTIDTNVLKNALYVCIPGTNHSHGIDLSAILGVFNTPDKELAIFESIKTDPKELLNIIKEKGLKERVKINQCETTGIFIKSHITFNDGNTSEATIRGAHANVISIKCNEIDLITKGDFSEKGDMNLEELKELSVEDMIYQIDNNLSTESKELIWQGLEMNMKVAKLGLKECYGDGIGFANTKIDALKNTTLGKICSNVAAATDVRMSGFTIPVMSNVGSGNQGLIISVSLAVLAENVLNKPMSEFTEDEKDLLIKTKALATEVTAYTTSYTGMLSNLCGCLCKAGVGTAAGMGYFLYHFADSDQIKDLSKSTVVLNSMKNMIASTCGVLCDGAKGSCANKSKSAGFNSYTSAQEALLNAVGSGGIPGNENTGIKTIMKNFVETYIEKFGQPTDLHIVNYLLSSTC